MQHRQDFITAIAQQPQCMRIAAEVAAQALSGWNITPWAPGQTVVVVGMGSSTNAGAVFTETLRGVGVRAVNIDAAAVANYPAGFCPGEHVIVISESGRSPEPIAAAQRMGVVPIVVTNDAASPVAQLSDFVVPLGGFLDSGVYTIGYTTTLVALAAIAQAHGVTLVDPAALADVAGDVLNDFASSVGDISAVLDKVAVLDIVGQGMSLGSAQAAALLFRESCGLATAAHQTIQYLHGPMESCGPQTAVLLFGDGRERGIAEQLRAAGVPVIHFAAGAPSCDKSCCTEETSCCTEETSCCTEETSCRTEETSCRTEETSCRTEEMSFCAKSQNLADAHAETLHPTNPVDGFASSIAEIVFAQAVAAQLAGLRQRDVGHFRFEQPDTKLPR